MKQYRHIIINDDAVRAIDFKAQGFGRPQQPERRDRQTQATRLRTMYMTVLNESSANRDAIDIDSRYKSTGSYIEVEINKKSINIESLDSSRGAKLMNIKTKEEEKPNYVSATLFLADKNRNWLEKRLDKYSDPEKDSARSHLPANSKLIDNIEKISTANLLSMFTDENDREKFERFPEDLPIVCELWIYIGTGVFDESDLFGRIEALNIEHSRKCCVFVDMVVVLIKGTKQNLNSLTLLIDNLSEIRLFKQASVLLASDLIEQTDWMNLIADCAETGNHTVRIGIIDSGVNNSHPLLKPFLATERCHNATSAGSRDQWNHGSLLAGLALYGDITDIVYTHKPIRINTDLTSVKIMPGPDETPNMPEFYGAVTEDAIITASNDGANIQCSAVTAKDNITDGEPSSWSAAIDETLFNNGEADTVLFLSAGNVKYTNGVPYPDFNINTEVKDPAQSWNAVTVGACTEKCLISNPNFTGIQSIAPRGGLSPYSATSMLWSNGLIKPEILMEGGNAIERDGNLDTQDDIGLASTSAKWPGKCFDGVYATSAASALAARLAAKIQCNNPTLSALSIRALMIHSAEWTDEMIRQNTENGNLKMHNLLHSCGYGVPREEKAIASNDCYATFVSEQTLTPLVENSDGKYKLASMHLYNLPWPHDILEQLNGETVKLRITLSYYIQPAPGSKTRRNKYRYPSLRLRFDVNKPTETEEQFISRISHIDIDGVERSSNDTGRWTIGVKERDNGSIISDYIEASAADIAACNIIAVFPASGWWNGRKYTGDKSIRYSLVVSIETKEAEIFTSIAQPISIDL